MVAVTLLTVAAYANAFSGGFVLDSLQLVIRDARVHAATTDNLRQVFSHTYWWPFGESGLYRPVTTLSFLVNYAVVGNGAEPFGYHAVNLALHVANVWLVYALLKRLTPRWLAIATCGLWAVHPLTTEAVTNIAGRADLLAAVCVLAGLDAYCRWRETAGTAASVWLIVLSVTLLIGVFAKESAVALAGIIAIAHLSLRRVTRAHRLAALAAALSVPLLLLWIARAIVIGGAAPAEFPFIDNPLVAEGWITSRATALVVAARYLWLLLWPAALSADYSYPAIVPLQTTTAFAVLGVASITAAAAGIALFRWNRDALLLGIVAVICWLPSSNLLLTSGTIMAERTMYLPATALIACALVLVEPILRRLDNRAVLGAMAALAVALAVRTAARNRDWQSDVTLWTATTISTPRSAKAHRALADALYAADPQRTQIDRIVDEADAGASLLQHLPDDRSDFYTFRQAGAFRLDRAHARGGGRRPAEGSARADFTQAVQHLARAAAIARVQGQKYGETATNRLLADVARLQTAAHLGLGDTAMAETTARQATAADPLNPLGYRLLAESLIERDPDAAAAQLTTGGLVTGDAGFTGELIRLYRAGLDQEGCATGAAGGAPSLNPDCEIVRRHSCAAARNALPIARVTRNRTLEANAAALVERFDCQP